jgi:hypothetical protein
VLNGIPYERMKHYSDKYCVSFITLKFQIMLKDDFKIHDIKHRCVTECFVPGRKGVSIKGKVKHCCSYAMSTQ